MKKKSPHQKVKIKTKAMSIESSRLVILVFSVFVWVVGQTQQTLIFINKMMFLFLAPKWKLWAWRFLKLWLKHYCLPSHIRYLPFPSADNIYFILSMAIILHLYFHVYTYFLLFQTYFMWKVCPLPKFVGFFKWIKSDLLSRSIK